MYFGMNVNDEDRKYLDAVSALRRWFKSQELNPEETVFCCQVYLAQLIVMNSGGNGDTSIEEKQQLCDGAIRDLAQRLVFKPEQ
jgi:hypothetical protein